MRKKTQFVSVFFNLQNNSITCPVCAYHENPWHSTSGLTHRLQVEAKWGLKDSSNNSLVTKSETEAQVMSQTDTYRFP